MILKGPRNTWICTLKKLSSSIVSGKPKSDYKHLYSSSLLLINQNDFKRNNVYFSAQETPGKKIPTDLLLEKDKLLCCFRQAKQWLQIFIFIITNKSRRFFKRKNVHFSAQETPGEKFPQICSLEKLSSSVVSGKPNSDYKYFYSSLLFLRERMCILVPKKHLGKKFPQICSLKKLSSSVVAGKPNSSI